MEIYDNYNYNLENLKERIKEKMVKKMNYAKSIKRYSEIIFLCIGTDRITGDCFGPLVGTNLKRMLENSNIFNITIYGTLIKNVNYSNIEQVIRTIQTKHSNPSIVVIDAALSKKENIGNVYIEEGKTILGKGLNKSRIEVGDLSIKAVVGKDYKIPAYNFSILQNISLNTVYTLSNVVSEAIIETIKYN